MYTTYMLKKLNSYAQYKDDTKSVKCQKTLDKQTKDEIILHSFTASQLHSFTASQLKLYFNKVFSIPYRMAVSPTPSMKRVALLFVFALCYYLLFCCTALPAQVVTLQQSVTSLSINSDDTVLAVSDSASISTYNTSSYTLISNILENDINRILFYQEQNGELLIAMTHTGRFLLCRRSSDNKKIYGKTEEYLLTDYAEGKTITCNAFSKHTNYSAAAFTDFSIQIHFKLRFIQDMITRTVEGHQSAIYGLEFSNDEKHLASVSKDGAAYIWSCSNSKQAGYIDNVYTDSAIPVYFTADSTSVISLEDEESLRISTLQGQKVTGINTGRTIRALLPLSDPDTIAVLNDSNEIVIYSLQMQNSVGVMRLPEAETSDITAFDFCHTEKAVFVGCASGAVYKLNLELQQKPEDKTSEREKQNAASDGKTPERKQQGASTENKASEHRQKATVTEGVEEPAPPQKQDNPALQEEPAQEPLLAEEQPEAAKTFKAALKNEKSHFLTASILAGFLQPEKTNFQYLFGADVAYRNTYFTAPVYVGVGLRAHMALPKRPFPVQYEDFNGKAVAPPFLWMGEVYAPVGIEVVLDRRGYAVLFEEAAVTARLSTLAQPKAAASKPFFSYGGRLTTGISVKFFIFAVALNYDSLWKLFPEITLGGRIDFKRKPKAEKEAV